MSTCQCLTAAGNPCKNAAKYPLKAHVKLFCGRHKNCKQQQMKTLRHPKKSEPKPKPKRRHSVPNLSFVDPSLLAFPEPKPTPMPPPVHIVKPPRKNSFVQIVKQAYHKELQKRMKECRGTWDPISRKCIESTSGMPLAPGTAILDPSQTQVNAVVSTNGTLLVPEEPINIPDAPPMSDAIPAAPALTQAIEHTRNQNQKKPSNAIVAGRQDIFSEMQKKVKLRQQRLQNCPEGAKWDAVLGKCVDSGSGKTLAAGTLLTDSTAQTVTAVVGPSGSVKPLADPVPVAEIIQNMPVTMTQTVTPSGDVQAVPEAPPLTILPVAENSTLNKKIEQIKKEKPQAVISGRSDLLSQIQKGITLKKTKQASEPLKPKPTAALNPLQTAMQKAMQNIRVQVADDENDNDNNDWAPSKRRRTKKRKSVKK
jgi:hypothetical protein